MTTVYPHTNSRPLERFVYWISEREQIRVRKAEGAGQPYTSDPILNKYRFCNVRREDDRVTRWIAHNWRDPNGSDSSLWHAMLVSRYINWPPTLDYCGYPEPWSQQSARFTARLKHVDQSGAQVFTGAYIISTNGAKIGKVEHVLKLFDRSYLALKHRMTLVRFCGEAYVLLRTVDGIGSFMAAQIVADLKYTPLLREAKDWHTFVAPGPGSMRGLNRVLEYDLQTKWSFEEFAATMRYLKKTASKLCPFVETLHLQDLQNCLCEFDKYERVLHDQGKPRSQYRPSTEPLP